jgi:hypothetical protein
MALEPLDARLMMTASPLWGTDAASAASLELPPAADVVEADQVVEWKQAVPSAENAILPGGGAGYPNPEDDDDDWGPLGPWVHQAVIQIGQLFEEVEPEEDPIQWMPGGQHLYPAPDDDGPWGPIGPVVHERLLAAGDANADLVVDQHDVVQILKAGKYMSGESADWSEGDFNRDGFFNQRDIVAMQQQGQYLRGPYLQMRVDEALIGLLQESAHADRPEPRAELGAKPRPPIVKDIDRDRDGTAEFRFYDKDGDGDADVILQNSDDDKNPDGTPNWDRGLVDGDGDNDYDHYWSDTDGDGNIDPNEITPIGSELPVLPMP